MALLLAKKLSHSHSLRLRLRTPCLSNLTLLPLLQLSTASDQPKDPPFLAQYLISSFGFSPDRALKVATSPHFASIKTPDRPEALVRLLKETVGLTQSQISSLISWYPPLLRFTVSKFLEPNIHNLVSSGFTGETLRRLVHKCPSVLILRSAPARLQFWRDFAGDDEVFIKIIQRNYRLLQLDIDQEVLPTINFLKESGFSNLDILRLYKSIGGKLKSPDIVKKLIEETEAFGFARDSRMFVLGLNVVGRVSRDLIKRKFEFFRINLGWSDEETRTAFSRFPSIVSQSEKTLKIKIDFLLGTVGFTNKSLISEPANLGYSLQKRLVPRHHVLNLLKIKGLNKGASVHNMFSLSEQRFLDKFIVPYKAKVPELEEIYAASCQGKMSI